MEQIIYFSVNNWFCGEHYPNTDVFRKWMADDLNLQFCDDEWAKANRLCINVGSVDMSVNFTVSAPMSFVIENCPEILGSKFEVKAEEGDDKPNEDEFGQKFLEFSEDNFGVHYVEE